LPSQRSQLASCTSASVERFDGPETTVTGTSGLSATTSLPLAAQGCPGASEYALYDVFLDAEADVVGFATPEQALDDFRRHDDGFRLRSDWQDLSLDRVALRGDSAVGQYSNHGGMLWLSVTLTDTPSGWLVTGWEGCAPPGVGP
jgi:hypothetical protein